MTPITIADPTLRLLEETLAVLKKTRASPALLRLITRIDSHLQDQAEVIARQGDFTAESDAIIAIIEDCVAREMTREQALACVNDYMKKHFY